MPVQLEETRVEVDASIGIAFGPADGIDAESILRAADIAMYRAKGADRGTFRFYEQSMDDELRARAELEADVRRAVSVGKIEPYYQPLVELDTRKLVGFEILARWSHPKKGNIPPLEFIPIIEHLGLIGDFTWGILRHACIDARGWPVDLALSVNISPSQLRDPTFPVRLLQVLQDTGFSPRRLEIEITETALLTDIESVKAVLVSLQALGIKVAIDDFGTGYSSLNHLRELKLDKIKIDRSFIQSMNEEPESAKIVNAILGLARSLGLPTTAEGIEDAEVAKPYEQGRLRDWAGVLFCEGDAGRRGRRLDRCAPSHGIGRSTDRLREIGGAGTTCRAVGRATAPATPQPERLLMSFAVKYRMNEVRTPYTRDG